MEEYDMAESEMSKTSSFSLTAIVAATHPNYGIGKGGSLPWPMLKGEMGFFSRVTKRTEPADVSTGSRVANAIIMGRNTWNSIPEKLRPLKGRINIVVSSSMQPPGVGGQRPFEGPYVRSSFVDALRLLQHREDGGEPSKSNSHPDPSENNERNALPSDVKVSRSFVIGGTSIYDAALQQGFCDRLLVTKIRKDFECDVFFPLDPEDASAVQSGWRRRTSQQWAAWTGELEDDKPKDTHKEEEEVPYEFCLYERESSH